MQVKAEIYAWKFIAYRIAYFVYIPLQSPCIRGVLQRRLSIVRSPAKKQRSPKKVPWTSAEDLALVQYIALHKDEQATEKEWPAMRAESDYWLQAAQYVQSATGVQYLRKGKLKMNYQVINIDYTIQQIICLLLLAVLLSHINLFV